MRRIAMNLLSQPEDAQECVNDAYLALWNSIPPQRPESLAAYAMKITRNLALKALEKRSALKRSACGCVALEELSDCVSGSQSVENEAEARRIERLISDFISAQIRLDRLLFVRRYWYGESLDYIAESLGISRSRAASRLHRLRLRLRAYLEKEGVQL